MKRNTVLIVSRIDDERRAEMSENESYLVNGISLIIVNNPDFESVRKIDHWVLFDIQYVVNWKRNFDTITIIM